MQRFALLLRGGAQAQTSRASRVAASRAGSSLSRSVLARHLHPTRCTFSFGGSQYTSFSSMVNDDDDYDANKIDELELYYRIQNATANELRLMCKVEGLDDHERNSEALKKLLMNYYEIEFEIDHDDLEDEEEKTENTDLEVAEWENGMRALTVPEIKERLRDAGLKVGGRKAELIDRLKLHQFPEYDSKEEAEEEGGEEEQEVRLREDAKANESIPLDPSPKGMPVDLSRVQTKTTCVFDKANNYQMVTQQSLVEENRREDMLLSPTLDIPDESDSLLKLLPYHYLSSSDSLLHDNANRGQLMDINLDLGRRPICWLNGHRHFLLPTASEKAGWMRQAINGATAAVPQTMTLHAETRSATESEEGNTLLQNDSISSPILPSGDTPTTTNAPSEASTETESPYVVTEEDLQHVLGDLRFGHDNRAGVERSLHRISAHRNRDGNIVGATLRVGRYVPGNALLIADLLYRTNSSILFVGPPGSAKTSILRDAARILSLNRDQNVVVVDTSCEIGGAGDVPHECIGMSRRMQVKNIKSQAKVMVECVQNHTPGVIVIDEIGRQAEVEAALTCKERGVRILASAHGSLPGLVRNAELCDLVGGVDVVTIGDRAAQKQAQKGGSGSKLKAERKGPPVFDAVVELKRGQLHEWQVVLQTQHAVDNILQHGKYWVQMRSRRPDGQDGSAIEVHNVEHQVNRDEILEQQHTWDASMSINKHTNPQVFNPDRVDWDTYTTSNNRSTCPVCEKMLKTNKGMKAHVLNTPCQHSVPAHVLEYFERTLKW